MTTSSQEFDAYLDGGGKEPAVIKAWTKALALEAVAAAAKPAAVEPVLKPAAVDSRPEQSTADFLREQESLTWKKRREIETQEMVDRAAKFDHEAEAEHQRVRSLLHIGARTGGFTPLGPVEGPLK